MTLQEALDLADALKPNMMPRNTKIHFLNEIENQIYEELLLKHEHTEEEETRPEYDADTDDGTVLLVPPPYDMLYVYWLMSKIDMLNMETEKYNNDRALFETQYEDMSNWWTRTRMPIQTIREFKL